MSYSVLKCCAMLKNLPHSASGRLIRATNATNRAFLSVALHLVPNQGHSIMHGCSLDCTCLSTIVSKSRQVIESGMCFRALV